MDFSSDAAIFLSEFSNCTVTAILAGVVVKAPFPGIFDEKAETFRPYESERSILKPAVTVLHSDFDGIDSNHILEIRGKQYTFDGKPLHDVEGLTIAYLAVKK